MNCEAIGNFPVLNSCQIIRKTNDQPELELNILIENLSSSCNWQLKTENNKIYNGVCEPDSQGKCNLNLKSMT